MDEGKSIVKKRCYKSKRKEKKESNKKKKKAKQPRTQN